MNLEYTTPKGNTEHAFRMRLRHPCKGERHGQAKLTEPQVREILTRAARGLKIGDQKEMAAEFGVSFRRISSIVLRRTWRHIDVE